MKALLLCAGFGTRLKNLTESIPKSMLPVDGKPMLEYTIRHLESHGIKDIVINTHFMPESITGYFKDGSDFGVTIEYSYEDEPLGTAGALIKAKKYFIKEDCFFVIYGDVITDIDYTTLTLDHRTNKPAATIIVHKRAKSNSIVVIDESGLITDFKERPPDDEKTEDEVWVNSGIYCFSNNIFSYLPESGFCDFPRDIFKKLIDDKVLRGIPLKGYRMAVDSPERYAALQNDFKCRRLFSNLSGETL